MHAKLCVYGAVVVWDNLHCLIYNVLIDIVHPICLIYSVLIDIVHPICFGSTQMV